MNVTKSSIDDYLSSLADELTALGPVEVDEVLAEIRSHITDSITENGGDESAVLTQLGSPKTLGLRILEERGVLTKASTLEDAPSWMHRLSLTLDVAVTVCLLLLSAGIITTSMWLAFSSDLPRWSLVLLVVLIPLGAILLVWAVVRWLRTRRPGYTTLGMGVLGLQRVKVGATNRLIRRRDLPGLPDAAKDRLDRALRIACLTLAFAVLGSAITAAAYAIRQDDNPYREATAVMKAPYMFLAMGQVNELYDKVTDGSSEGDIEARFSPESAQLATDLISRRDSGRIASYQVADTTLLDSTALPLDPGLAYRDGHFFMSVQVLEYVKGQRDPIEYEYVLALRFNGFSTDDTNAQIIGTIKIVGARLVAR